MTVSHFVSYLGLAGKAFASGLTELEQAMTPIQKVVASMNQQNAYNVADMIKSYQNLKGMDLSGFTDAFKTRVQSLLAAMMSAFGHIQVSIDAGAGVQSFDGKGPIVNGHFALLLNSLNNYQPATIADLIGSMSYPNISQFTTGAIVWNTGSTVPWKQGALGADGEVDTVDANGNQIPGTGIQLNAVGIITGLGAINGSAQSLVGTAGGDSFVQSNPTPDFFSPNGPYDNVVAIVNQMGFPVSS